MNRPYSSMERTGASGAPNAGSNPARDTKGGAYFLEGILYEDKI
jgi:hypothetical protein